MDRGPGTRGLRAVGGWLGLFFRNRYAILVWWLAPS